MRVGVVVLVAGVVADPELILVPDQPGVTGVATGGQGEHFRESSMDRIEPPERGAERAADLALRRVPRAGVVTSGGDEASIRQPQQMRASEPDAEVFPCPLAIGRRGGSEEGGAGRRVGGGIAAHQAVGGAVVEEDGCLVGVASP